MVKNKLFGFTLIEVMVVILILGVLLVLALPNISSLGHGTRLSSYSNRFLLTLFLARSEAIKRNSWVVVCKSNDGTSCNPDGYWSQGWIVFTDRNNNIQVDQNEDLLLVEKALEPDWVVFGNLNVAKYVSYSSTGSSKLVGGGFQAGRISVCKKTETNAVSSRVVINSAGRPRTERVTLPSCPCVNC